MDWLTNAKNALFGQEKSNEYYKRMLPMGEPQFDSENKDTQDRWAAAQQPEKSFLSKLNPWSKGGKRMKTKKNKRRQTKRRK
jgi:hypothetical protein